MATRDRRRTEDFLDRPYAIALSRGEDAWTARVEELEGCEASGAGPEEAAGAVRAAMADWIGSALAEGRPIPPPHAAGETDGGVVVHVPPTLLAQLVRRADREGTTVDAVIGGLLDGAVGSGPASVPARRDRARMLSLALTANLVVVLVAAAVALGLLLLAWQSA